MHACVHACVVRVDMRYLTTSRIEDDSDVSSNSADDPQDMNISVQVSTCVYICKENLFQACQYTVYICKDYKHVRTCHNLEG
jgi:hypothetical protein